MLARPQGQRAVTWHSLGSVTQTTLLGSTEHLHLGKAPRPRGRQWVPRGQQLTLPASEPSPRMATHHRLISSGGGWGQTPTPHSTQWTCLNKGFHRVWGKRAPRK